MSERPSALKSRVCPLTGSPLQSSPSKAARTGETVAMEGLAQVPDFPVGSSGSMAPGNFFTSPVVATKVSDSPPENHLWKGAPGNRSMGPLSIVELASNAIRENCLTKLSGANATSLTDSTGKNVDVGRAKTALQLKRNASLKQAADVLKKDARTKGQTVEIVWRLEEVNGARSKDRGVKVGAVMAFVQAEKDITGTFQTPFADVTL